MQGLIDFVKFHLDSQLRFYDDLVPEIINTMSETFTTGEKKQSKERVTASSQKANSTLYPVIAKFLIPNFLGTDCFAGSIPALLVTALLSKIFVQKRSQLRFSGMNPG